MASKKLEIPPEFIAAQNEQRIEFVQDLWDQIAQEPASVPIPESHKRLLKERLDARRSNPQGGRSWADVKEELLAKIGKD